MYSIATGATRKKSYNNEIDLSLSVLCIIARRDETLSTAEIAEVCGCSKTLISQITRDALKKLRGHSGRILRDFI